MVLEPPEGPTIVLSLLTKSHLGRQFPHQCFLADLGGRRKLRPEVQRNWWVWVVGLAGPLLQPLRQDRGVMEQRVVASGSNFLPK